MIECSFLIPIKPVESWQERENFTNFHQRLLKLVGGYTYHLVEGAWVDVDDPEWPVVAETSRRYIIAVPHQKVGSLTELLLEFKPLFKQKKIYFFNGVGVRLI